MMRGARTWRRAHSDMISSALSKWPRAAFTSWAQAEVEAHAGERGGGIVGLDAGAGEGLARQIEAPDACILVEVAKNIGELERASEMMGKLAAGPCLEAEHLHR